MAKRGTDGSSDTQEVDDGQSGEERVMGEQGQGDYQGANSPMSGDMVGQAYGPPSSQPQVPQQFPSQHAYVPYPQQGPAPKGMPPQQQYPQFPYSYQQQFPPQQPRPNVAAKVFKVSLVILPLTIVLWVVACFVMGFVSWSSGAEPESGAMEQAAAIVGWLIGVVLAIDLPAIVVSGIVALVTR